MVNEGEMKTKKEKNEKWECMKEPNMALREKRDIRPHLVLDGTLCQKRFERERVRGES